MFKALSASIRKNHFAQMAICCLLPVFLILGLQLAGINGFWVYPLAFAVCIGSHVLMAHSGLKEGKPCH